MSPSSERSPHTSPEPDRFFDLLRQRGDLWRELRSPLTTDEGIDAIKEGNARDLLERMMSGTGSGVETRKACMNRRAQEDTKQQRALDALDRELRQMLSDPFIRKDIQRARQDRVRGKKENRELVEEYRDLLAVQDELDRQDYALMRSSSITDEMRNTLRRNSALREEVSRRFTTLAISPETARSARLAELLTYREQMQKHKFALTPSRQAVIDQVRSLWARKRAVLLTGSTGTGKTELLAYLTKKLYGRPLSRLVRATQDTTSAEIFGKMGLKSTEEGGTETKFIPGVYMDAIDQGMPFVIDEFNLLETQTRMGLKELYNRGPGDSIVIQQDSGKEHVIQEGFVIGATANVKGKKHKERFDLDAAETRALESRKVSFLPKEELYDVILASLMNERGEIRLAKDDAKDTLKRLLEAVELTQLAYEEKQTQFYAEGAGAKKTPALLEKAVIDPGRVLKMLSAWPREDARGKTFGDFLETELLHIIQTEDYPEKDRRLLLQIFITKGFFNGKTVKELDIPGVDEARLASWGWKDAKPSRWETETLSSAQVADLDPFELRRRRVDDAANDFLKGRSSEADLEDIDINLLPESVQELLARTQPDIDFKDFFTILESSRSLYSSCALDAWTKSLETASFTNLTQEKQDLIKAYKAQGYEIMGVMPGKDAQLQQLEQAIEKIKPLWIQNGNKEILNDTFVVWDHIKNLLKARNALLVKDVPDKPYLLLAQPTDKSPADDTCNKTLDEQKAYLTSLQAQHPELRAMNMGEYSVFQHGYTNNVFKKDPSIMELDPLDKRVWIRFIDLPVFNRWVPCGFWDDGNRKLRFGDDVINSSRGSGFRLAVRIEL